MCIFVFFATCFISWFYLGQYLSVFTFLIPIFITMLLGWIFNFKNKHDYKLAGKLFLDQESKQKKDN
jgi:energy-coupling factor transporter transmembrane protein EcfT